MLKRKSYFIIGLVLTLLLQPSFSLQAENARIGDLLVTNNTSHVLVYARVTNCFTKDMDAAILAGVPTTFTFLVDLYRERTRWFNKKIDTLVVKHTIKYDNVKRLFYVFTNENQEAVSFQDFESAKRAMSDLNGVGVTTLKTLNRGEYYYVLLKAKLDKVRLPLHMEYIFFFVSFWDFETDWVRGGFYY